MPTINATADNVRSQVRLDLDFSDIDAPYAQVFRVDAATGATTAVRGHGSSFTSGGVAYAPLLAGYRATLYDTEAALDQAFYYTATAPVVTLNATPVFSGGYVEPWYPTATTITLRPSSTRTGAWSMAMSTDGATATPQARAENIPATDGAAFTLTAVMSSNVSQSVAIGLAFRDGTGAILSSTSSTVTVLNSSTFTFTATGTGGVVSVQPFIQMAGTPAATTVLTVSSAAVTSAAGSATSRAVVVPSLGACQLKDPLRPGNNVRVDFAFDPNPQCIPAEGVFFMGLDTEQRAANAATFNINNQAQPQVVAKTRSSVTSTLSLVTRTFPDRDRLNALLTPGSPLLFQVPEEYGVPDQYLAIAASSVSRVAPDTRFPIRVFSLPYAAAVAPGGPMQGAVGARWSDTCNRYATWAAVKTAGLTWQQVLAGAAG